MKNSKRLIILLLGIIFILGGCSSMKSEEEALEDATIISEQIFNDTEAIKPNQEVNKHQMYIPKNLEIQSGDENNLILEDEDQTYILFNNTAEEKSSELNYQAAKTEDALLLETFEDDNKFGYIRILPDEGEGYELQVGVGGVKITTYTTKGKLDKDAEEMMKMAMFIAYME